VCLGIWAFGLLCYTIFLRMAIPILQGRLSQAQGSETLREVYEPGAANAFAADPAPITDAVS